MTIAEFCKGRNVDPQAVRRYIDRHPDEFAGLTGRKGREITLDTAAIAVLEQKYPLPKPMEVIKGIDPAEHIEALNRLAAKQDELNAAVQMIARLHEEMQHQAEQIAVAEAKQLLLEDKEKQLQELKEENQRLRNRSLWERIWNKGE